MNPQLIKHKIVRQDVHVEDSKRTLLNAVTIGGMQPTIIGSVTLAHGTPVAVMTMLFVNEAHRRQGLGDILVSKCIAIATTSRCVALSITIAKCNRGVSHFYHKRHFKLCYIFEDGTYLLSRAIEQPALFNPNPETIASRVETKAHPDSLAHRIATAKAIDFDIYTLLKDFRQRLLAGDDMLKLSSVLHNYEMYAALPDSDKVYVLDDEALQFLLELTF